MKKYNNLESLLDSLSEEERIIHQDLIYECIQRDREIVEASENARKNLYKFSEIIDSTFSKIENLQEEVKKLENAVQFIYINSIESKKETLN